MKKDIKYKYIVWVGGISNYFDNLLDAEINFIEWSEKGYSDLFIEEIKL